MTKIFNHINTYADLTAYNNDKDKNYPNIAYIIETNEVKWVKEKPDLVVCQYNVTSTSEATSILNSTTGITYQMIDGVRQDTVQTTYTFDTLGEHTVKYKLDGTSIANYAFNGCSVLTSVTIPNSVTEIGDDALSYCSSLTTITIPNSVTSIGFSAFDGTPWLNNQPDGLVYAGKVAYKYKGTMPSGTSIVLKEETKGIAGGAFWDCSGLTSITIGNSVTSIGDNAFNGCSGLTSITIPNSVTSIGNEAFYGCSGLTNVIIGNSVTYIGDNAFDGCSGLTSVTIPNSVTSIGNSAFRGCSGLTSITIGNSVTSIDDMAFYGCRVLTSITIQATTPPTLGGSGAFSNTNNCPIYVPAESVDAYKNATNWSSLADRISAIVA